MEEAILEASLGPEDSAAGIEAATRFLTILFEESDTILIRPIETWVENGRKRSQTDFRNTFHRRPQPSSFPNLIRHLLKLSESKKLNLFFGVCPRYGSKGRFDLAWQIRTVRTLWADIDHVTVDEARQRIVNSSLPSPSMIVNSGNGAHLYWLLDTPYLIDDAGEPLAVETEWSQTPEGRKKPHKYIIENSDKVYLDRCKHISRLSPKAQYFQDVLAGIARAVGGDHTTDLSRLLRIPGSWNRKDERNGRIPVLTELVECDPTRRYPLSAFESLKSESPETVRAKQIANMPLPKTRKSSSAKADRLAELIAASSIAETGCRSEADFAVCCYAIRQGIDKEEVWTQVEKTGKFLEEGRRYFDKTWENAEYKVRSETFVKLKKKVAPSHPQGSSAYHSGSNGNGNQIVYNDLEEHNARPTIRVHPETMPVADTLHKITDRLLAAGNCFSRTEQLVVIHNLQITTILTHPELAGLLNQLVEFFFIDDQGGEYKPLPASYANTWLNHHLERSRFPVIKLFTHNPVYTDDWRLVAPGFDAASGIYYAGPAIEARQGTEHLDTLLRDFCFKHPGDRTNYLGVLLTAMLIPRFIGSKPAALFNGNQPELGKSILAQIIAILRDGQAAETASYNPNDEEFEKRLGAIVRRSATTIIIDNAKSRGRNPRIESACLERSITDPILSYRLLGQSASIRAENSHIFCITANTPDVSRDLVTRSVVINLYYEGDPDRRTFSIADPEGFAQEHRLVLLGELIGMVERWKASGMPKAKAHSRFNKRGWGDIVGGILQANGQPDFLANAEEAAAQLDETRRDFAELVSILAEHPQGFWTAAQLVEFCCQHELLSGDLGDGSARSMATKMGTLAGRFVDARFMLDNGSTAVFRKTPNRNGSIYQVFIREKSAEP